MSILHLTSVIVTWKIFVAKLNKGCQLQMFEVEPMEAKSKVGSTSLC